MKFLPTEAEEGPSLGLQLLLYTQNEAFSSTWSLLSRRGKEKLKGRIESKSPSSLQPCAGFASSSLVGPELSEWGFCPCPLFSECQGLGSSWM